MLPRRLFLLAALAGIVIAGSFVVRSAGNDLVYYRYPSEAVAQRDRFPDGSRFMLAGIVVPGTLERNGSISTFQVTDGSATLDVRLTRTPPPLFDENVQVLLAGAFDHEVFLADDAIVQHDENYKTPTTGNE